MGVLHGGGRAYLATGGDIGDPYTYWAADLSNKHFAYSIDVHQVGCKCNAAMYWVNMPGMDGGNNPVPGPGGDYYCDANFVNDNWCPEYDTYEGNAETTMSPFTPVIMFLPMIIQVVTGGVVEPMPA